MKKKLPTLNTDAIKTMEMQTKKKSHMIKQMTAILENRHATLKQTLHCFKQGLLSLPAFCARTGH